MFDRVPDIVWPLIVITTVAYAPAVYVYHHINRAPSRRDITLPPEDLAWRTSLALARNLALLAALGALAIFIFTPAARQFAQSPYFLPTMTAIAGAWPLLSIAIGLLNGRVEPFMRGVHRNYDRESQPRRFWASMSWNALVGGLAVWLTSSLIEDAPRQHLTDRCYDSANAFSRQEAMVACNQLIAEQGSDDPDSSSLFSARGSINYRASDYASARSDYATAARLDPDDASAHYNLGLADEKLGNRARAALEYGEAIILDPGDVDSYLNRGLIYLDFGQLAEAESDFTRAHELRPKDPWAIADRGLTYAWRNDRVRAERDFAAVRAIDPSNPAMLRGEALLAFNSGNLPAAVQSLTAALKVDPRDKWSLRMRASAYEKLGQEEQSLSDRDQLWRMSRETR